jgi:DNA repair protein RadC
MAGIELGRRVATEIRNRGEQRIRITSADAAVDYCRELFARLAIDGRQEEFHVVTLDTKYQPLTNHRITVGTLDASLVHPREVFRPAIRDAAAAVLLVHNHPSGDPTPSGEDRKVTRQLEAAGRTVGIQVLDHIVVAGETALSLKQWEADGH